MKKIFFIIPVFLFVFFVNFSSVEASTYKDCNNQGNCVVKTCSQYSCADKCDNNDDCDPATPPTKTPTPIPTVKCTCATTTPYSACGTYQGRTNVMHRKCTLATTGTSTCIKVGTGTTATYQQVVACYNCKAPWGAFTACTNFNGYPNSKRRTGTLSTATTTTKCQKAGTTYYNFVACPTATKTPTPTGPTKTPTPTKKPTPTVNPLCVCNAQNVCTTQCYFSKYTGITYTTPPKCNLTSSSTLYPSTPSAANKTDWCRRSYKTKGDADGNDIINKMDYFYYVAAVNGGKIPVTVNPDFNGDGEVGVADRAIIIKSPNL